MLTPLYAAIAGATAAHPYNLEVNATDIIAKVPMESIRLEMAGPGSNGSMSFTVFDPDASFTIVEWDEVIFTEHAATRPVLFGGFVQSVRMRPWATTGRYLEVECVGYGILLDKKVVTTAPERDTVKMAWALVSLVNRYGGIITAREAPSALDYAATDATYSLPKLHLSGGLWSVAVDVLYGIEDNVTLRSAIDSLVALAGYVGPVWPPTQRASVAYWVDGTRRFCALPDLPTCSEAERILLQYDEGTVPGIHVDGAGTYRVTGLYYEREDTDRVTAAHIKSTTAAGTGWYRTTPPERAGDLEAPINDDGSTTLEGINERGGAAVAATTASTARGEVAIQSSSALAIWPGRNLRITDTRLGLSASDWRMSSVRIEFQSRTARTYVIGFGGNVPGLALRQGRYVTR